MGYGVLPEPGSKLGPCAETCQHIDCAETRRMAAAPCEICDQPIGYDRRFYNGTSSGSLVHAACLEDRLSR